LKREAILQGGNPCQACGAYIYPRGSISAVIMYFNNQFAVTDGEL